MGIIYTSIVVFSIATLLGMYLLILKLRNKSTSKEISIFHTLLAGIGLGLLIIYAGGKEPGPIVSIGLFSAAAVAGSVIFFKNMTGQKTSKVLSITHGLIAVSGFVILLQFAFTEKLKKIIFVFYS